MLDLNWSIVWIIINLLILFVALKFFLFKPVTKIMDERKRQIENSIKQAEEKNTQAEALRKQYEEQLHQAGQEAADIIKDAKVRASKEYDDILQSAKENAKMVEKESEQKIAREREKAMQSAKQELAGVVLLTASKLSQKNMDEKANHEFVDAFLSEVGAKK